MVGAHLVGILTNKTRKTKAETVLIRWSLGVSMGWLSFKIGDPLVKGGLWGTLYLWSNGWQRSEGVEELLRVYINQYYKDASGKWKFCEIILVSTGFRGGGHTQSIHVPRYDVEQVPRRQFQVNILKTNTLLNLVGIIVIFRYMIYVFMLQRYLGKKQFDP